MSGFKVGDLVEIIDAPTFVNRFCRCHIGHIGVITGPSIAHHGNWLVQGAELDAEGKRCSFCPNHLRLRRPPSNYDGNQAGDWDLCPFKPSLREVAK